MKRARTTVAIAAATVIALTLSGSAAAAPPVLVSVSQVQGHAQASWTLPPGVEPMVIEVATSPQTGSDGSFFTENLKDIDLLSAGQTSWLSSYQLSPGVYYVHVGGWDDNCDECGQEFSNILQLTVPLPPDTTAPSATPLFSIGHFKRRVALKYIASDDRGLASVTATIYSRAGKPIGHVAGPTQAADGATVLALAWSAPAKPKRPASYPYRFCVVAEDPAGNTSTSNCAPLRLT